MGLGRIVSTTVTVAAVGGCAVLAVGMATAAPEHRNVRGAAPALPSWTTTQTVPAYRLVTPAAVSSSSSRAGSGPLHGSVVSTPVSSGTRVPVSSAETTLASRPVPPSSSRRAPTSSTAHSAPRTSPHSSPTHPPTRPPTHAPPPPRRGGALPLSGYYTGTATRVITVVAHSTGSTVATLQAWTKAPGGGWLRYGASIYAHIGADGMTRSPSEFRSATPIGSFSLTQAFGRYSDPGTALPYFQTTPADWWISQSGSLYNTHQHCWSGCSFTQGSPNEHLYYETPYYNYAVVINTPSGSGAYPHGSAFFLHVTDGRPTAGCVAIPQSNLVPILRWLTPSAHPRILIGTA